MEYIEIIKNILITHNLSQDKLAKILGVSFVSVNRWENGHHEPTIKVKRKIAQLIKENGIEVK